MRSDPRPARISPLSARRKSVNGYPGVYAILDGERLLYAGMAGRGGLRQRPRAHRDGTLVNMFQQYLWFAVVQHQDDALVSSPGEAAKRCRAYISERLSFACLQCSDDAEARAVEAEVKQGESGWGLAELNPG